MPSVSRRSRRIAVYAGSFDPPDLGHVWMVRTGASLFDELIVAVGTHPDKRGFFYVDDRLRLLKRFVARVAQRGVDRFENEFLVDYARSVGARFILRGVRNPMDLRIRAAPCGRSTRTWRRKSRPSFWCRRANWPKSPRPSCAASSGLKGWPKVVRRFLPGAVYREFLKRCKDR